MNANAYLKTFTEMLLIILHDNKYWQLWYSSIFVFRHFLCAIFSSGDGCLFNDVEKRHRFSFLYIIWTNLNNQTSVTDSLQWVSHPSGIQWCITVNELAFYPEENQKSYCACVQFCHRKTNVSTLYYLRYNAWCKLDNIFVQIKVFRRVYL